MPAASDTITTAWHSRTAKAAVNIRGRFAPGPNFIGQSTSVRHCHSTGKLTTMADYAGMRPRPCITLCLIQRLEPGRNRELWSCLHNVERTRSIDDMVAPVDGGHGG